MDKEELEEKFYKNIEYLQRNIPPDDIYIFTEQTFMAAMFFMHKWSKKEDLNEVCKTDPIAKKWINNILNMQKYKDANEDLTLNLDLESLEKDENINC